MRRLVWISRFLKPLFKFGQTNIERKWGNVLYDDMVRMKKNAMES